MALTEDWKTKERRRILDTLERLREIPDSHRMFHVYMGEAVRLGKCPDIGWAYAQARELHICTECVSKVAAYCRRYIKFMEMNIDIE